MHNEPASAADAPQLGAFTLTGAALTASVAFGLVWAIHWARGDSTSSFPLGRVTVVMMILAGLATFAYAYIRRQWLQYLRQQILTETGTFIANAQDLDGATTAAMTLIQEVELVSRGYRM